MAVYNVHGGHNRIVTGASKFLDEVTEDRKVKDAVIALLRASGHIAYDCTDDVGRTSGANLANIVSKCNAHGVDLDISIHLNAGGGTGVEVLYYSNSGKAWAEKMSSKIAGALGLADRGAKYRDNLYVLKHTKAPAVLAECCFVDNNTDVSHWNVDTCARAIVEAVTGASVSGGSSGSASQPSPASGTMSKKVGYNPEIAELQSECNKQGFSRQIVDGIPGKNTLAGCPVLKRGASGNITKWVQRKLSSLGYSCGDIDGKFGDKTKSAVVAFQRAKGLAVDGIVGPKTWSKLLGLS